MPPPPPGHILGINRAEVHRVLYVQSCLWDQCFQFTDVTFNINSPSFYSALICLHEVYQNNPPCDANHPPKRIKILKQKMVRPTTEAREWGGGGGWGGGGLGVTLTKFKIYGGWGVWERHSQNVNFMGGKRRWNTLIYPRQFAFRKPISTQTPLLYRLLTKSFSI